MQRFFAERKLDAPSASQIFESVGIVLLLGPPPKDVPPGVTVLTWALHSSASLAGLFTFRSLSHRTFLSYVMAHHNGTSVQGSIK
jgi:hypothetical protein